MRSDSGRRGPAGRDQAPQQDRSGVDESGGKLRAERLRAKFENTPAACGEFAIRATASFGMAAFPEHGVTADSLIAAADAALYASKKAGRNRVSRYAVSEQTVG